MLQQEKLTSGDQIFIILNTRPGVNGVRAATFALLHRCTHLLATVMTMNQHAVHITSTAEAVESRNSIRVPMSLWVALIRLFGQIRVPQHCTILAQNLQPPLERRIHDGIVLVNPCARLATGRDGQSSIPGFGRAGFEYEITDRGRRGDGELLLEECDKVHGGV